MTRGAVFTKLEYSKDENGKLISKEIEDITIPCDAVILAIGQENAFPFIERDLGIEFNEWDMPEVDRVTFQCSRPGIFFGGDAAWGPENIIWAVAHGHKAAISIHNYCQGIPITERPPEGITLLSQKMGHHEWSYSNDYDFLKRRDVPLVELKKRLRSFPALRYGTTSL